MSKKIKETIREIIFQAFNWTLRAIIENLPLIAAQGFTIIQTSPLQQHKEAKNPAWFLGYQVTNFKIGNRLGTKEDLIELVEEAHKYGIKIIVDCVFNHVGNAGNMELELVPSPEVEPEIRNRPEFFHERKAVKDYTNRYQCTMWSINLPDLNTANHELQNIHIQYIRDLLSCNIDGMRLDAAKHIELNDDSWCGSDYWDNVLGSIENREELFIYGEVLFSDTNLVDRYCKLMNVGVNNGSGSDKTKLVKWKFSHDDELTFFEKKKENQKIIDDWKDLLKSNKESHVLFYPPSKKAHEEDLWKDERFKHINNKYR